MLDEDDMQFYLYVRWEQAADMYRGEFIPDGFLPVKLDSRLKEEYVNKHLLQQQALSIMNEIMGIGQWLFGKDYIPGYK